MSSNRRPAARPRLGMPQRRLSLARAAECNEILLEMYERAPLLNARQLYDYALDVAVRLTQSEVGFFHLVSEDQKSVILTTWNAAALMECTASADSHYPIEEAGNWVDCVREQRAVVYNEYATSPNRKGLPPGHAELRRFAAVPVLEGERVRMIFGVGNKVAPYDRDDIRQLNRVARELQKLVLQRASEEQVRRLNAELEKRVADRTTQLEQANRLLREREVELWEKELRWRTLFEMASDAIFLLSDDVVIQCNEQALELFGVHERDAIVDHALWEYFPPSQPDGRDSLTASKEIWEALDDAVPRRFEWTCRKADGVAVHTEVTARRLEISGHTYVQAIVRDVTKRLEAEQLIRKLSHAVDQSPVGVVITDSEGVIEYVNPEFTRMTGYAADEALGHTPRILKSGRHPIELFEDLWATIKRGATWHGELCNRRKDGSHYWEASAIAPVLDAHGEIRHFVAVKQDVTDARRVAAELEQAKTAAEVADRLKTAFLANMSHELRTPLNAVLGFSQLMQQDPDLRHDHQQSVDIVIKSGHKLLKLIDEIIDMSKIEANCLLLRPTLFDLPLLLDDVRETLAGRAEAKGLQLDVWCSPDIPRYVSADEARVRQVMMHLLSNAVKFTREGTISVNVSALNRSEPSSMVPITVEVNDTGCGIAHDELNRVFIPFDQTSSGRHSGGGTGLSMSFSRELARLMGGDLDVASELGRGTRFVFTFLAERLDNDVTTPSPSGQPDPQAASREACLREAAVTLPQSLRQRLYVAVERADVDVFGQLLQDADLADQGFLEALGGLASGYQYETLLRVLAP